jgi:membrane protein YqaA with SNARE-associated domain
MAANTGRLYNWALQRTESRKAPLWIGLIFFLELVLFIPLDAILMFFCLQNRRRIFLYVMIAAVSSTLSGLVGYLLGHFLWDLIGPYIVPHLITASTFEHFAHHYQNYENWAVFVGSFLPIPMKVLSLSAGSFELGLAPFLGFLFLARFLRFSLVGGAMYIWGETVKGFVDRHFKGLFVIIGAKIALGFAFFYAIAQ